MNLPRFALSLISIAFVSGCAVVPTTNKVALPKEVVDFVNTSNLIYGNDHYWIKDVPELKDFALGTVYKRESKTVSDITYYAASLVGEKGFTDISKDKIEDGEFTLNKNFSYSSSNTADLAILAAFSGNASEVSEIKKKFALTAASRFKDDEALTPREKYCDSDHYYVSRVYVGASSEYGLQEIKYQAKVAFVEVGSEVSGNGRTELHDVRQGVLALTLQPFANLSKCVGANAKALIALPKRTKIALPELTFRETLEAEGFVDPKAARTK